MVTAAMTALTFASLPSFSMFVIMMFSRVLALVGSSVTSFRKL